MRPPAEVKLKEVSSSKAGDRGAGQGAQPACREGALLWFMCWCVLWGTQAESCCSAGWLTGGA
jgi:hypothetical protein